MARFFEELDVWQKALELTKKIYSLTNNGHFRKDFSFSDQIRRASVSVLSNISEGFERGSNTEFIQFLYIAKGSCGEVRAQLYLAQELGYVTAGEFKEAINICKSISSRLSSLISYLKDSRMKGEKYKYEYKSMREEVEKIMKDKDSKS
jgi:four helix bundle protein